VFLRCGPSCPDCKGTGWLRPPAHHHWIGTTHEGGALTPAHAEAAGLSLDELAGALLVRAAEQVVAGLGGIAGLLGRWAPSLDGYLFCGQMTRTGLFVDTSLPVVTPSGRRWNWVAPGNTGGFCVSRAHAYTAADHAALAVGFALLGDAEGRACLRLPEVT
jgi:hypothetical protein